MNRPRNVVDNVHHVGGRLAVASNHDVRDENISNRLDKPPIGSCGHNAVS
jgi:hypothetical protein